MIERAYYDTQSLENALGPQCLLATEMNGLPLAIAPPVGMVPLVSESENPSCTRRGVPYGVPFLHNRPRGFRIRNDTAPHSGLLGDLRYREKAGINTADVAKIRFSGPRRANRGSSVRGTGSLFR
jgi:hypothetical protein